MYVLLQGMRLIIFSQRVFIYSGEEYLCITHIGRSKGENHFYLRFAIGSDDFFIVSKENFVVGLKISYTTELPVFSSAAWVSMT